MRNHPSDGRLIRYAADGSSATGATALERHLTGCDPCEARLASIRAALSALEALPPEAEPPHDLWPLVEKALGRRMLRRDPAASRPIGLRWLRAPHAGRIAAGFALLLAGAAIGRVSVPEAPSGPAPAPGEDAADVQLAGTRYVEALASFASATPHVAPAELEQGRAAAYAAVYGAARELLALSPGDPWAAGLVELAERGRNAPPSSTSRVRF